MKDLLLRIYDFFLTHRQWLWVGMIGFLLLLIAPALSLRYNEDIMDFLPATEQEREAFHRMQAQQSAARLIMIVEGDSLCDEAMEACADQIADLQTEPDMDEQLQQLYAQMPLFIADSIYERFDSLFTSASIRAALQRDKAILSTPGASALTLAIQSDPLGMINLTDLLGLNTHQQDGQKSKSYAYLESPYGGTETARNAKLIDSLQAITQEVESAFSDIHIRWTGAPVIAVGNARRIKTDTLTCIALSLVLIISLLTYSFPRRKDLWLILLAISFGWLSGMAVLRIVTPTVSAVVLGIGSVLIGIAVNYPLHLLVHQRYTSSVRQTLDEVLSPLVIGNITTVGAFLTLIPLQSTAMKHLGVFASSMLVGTILFCIIILPHMMSAEPTPIREIKLPVKRRSSSTITTRHASIVQWTVVGITILFGCYLIATSYNGKRTELFDSNLSHINYMTAQQRADLAALDSKRNDPSRWVTYWQSHDAQIVIERIKTEAQSVGFRPEAFSPFYTLLTDWQPTEAFELSNLTKRLSDDFDYICMCCSVIVFAFLWFSFRNLGLAFIAFVPMALSWVWILALMQLFGLQFNIVNIILATFIFGQGDDYTIFIVEGLLYEHRTGKTILPQYRQSILLSALIMLIGIGVLAFAIHPAMRSLGIITLLGMSIVLLMALTLPPLLFKLYIRLFDRT